MITDRYADFFLGTAGAAAALIGLLFVAVSVAAERPRDKAGEAAMQVRASSALLAFSNVMIISLVALTPDAEVGWTTTVVGSIGLLFGVSSGTVLLRSWHHRSRGALGLVIGFLVLFGFEVHYGLESIMHPDRLGPLSGITWVLVASISVGVARAWELVGLPGTGAISSIIIILRGFAPRDEVEPGAAPTGTQD